MTPQKKDRRKLTFLFLPKIVMCTYLPGPNIFRTYYILISLYSMSKVKTGKI